MITNSTSATGCTRKRGFRILTAVITVLFVCSVTVTAFATASAYSPVTVVDGSNSVSISSKTLDPHELVEEAGFALDPNDKIILSDYICDECLVCGNHLNKFVNFIQINASDGIRIPGKYCSKCDAFYEEKGSALKKLLTVCKHI
jgi:hypothetical protein